MSGKTREYFGSIKTAGRTISGQEDTTAVCFTTPQVPETPPQIKKYRKSYKQQHGVTILHPGLVDAPKPQGNYVYGKKTDPSDRTTDIFRNQHEGIKELILNINEQKYASRQKEPLAQVPSRNYQWPEEVHKDEFAFGQKIPPSEYTAKEVVFPPDAKKEDEKNRLMYLRSHGNYEAGEQKNREYQWQVNKDEFRFGKKEDREQNQMKNVLQQENSSNQYPKTTIIQKNQEDWKNYNEDPIGRPKNLAQVNARMPEVFGVLKRDEQWTAGQCITGQANLKEVKPDNDLGRATKFGFRNTAKSGDETRVFGVPSVRNDIKKTTQKSVADPQNYGDEVPAVALLFPEKFSHMGLSQQDFLLLRTKAEIREIFESIGVKYNIGKFEGIYQRAKDIQNTFDEKVSVKAFQLAVMEMHDIE